MAPTKKQQADYEQLCRDRNSGRILTPDGLRLICEANDYDPEKIGRHFLAVLERLCPVNAVKISDEEMAALSGYKCPICKHHNLCTTPGMSPMCGEVYDHFEPKESANDSP